MSDQFFDHVASITDLVKQSVLVSFRNLLEVEFKSDESPVTKADLEAENLVRQYLAKHFPQDGIFGEEFGIEGVERENVWVVDPIDGTRSFLSGHPTFGFLLARLKAGIPELGVIAMPALNETLIGHRGIGASLNGKPVQVSSQKSLDQAILYVNEGDKIYKIHPEIFERLMNSGQTRRFAYDCYPHALVAMGHVDAVIDYDLQPYDYLAVSTVVKAAGGIATDWNGNSLGLNSGTSAMVSAATPELHNEILNLLKDA